MEITGSGFGTDPSVVNVTFGQSVCSVSDATDTMITCTTESTATVHYVNNSGLVPQCMHIPPRSTTPSKRHCVGSFKINQDTFPVLLGSALTMVWAIVGFLACL